MIQQNRQEMNKEELKENKVIINKDGDVEILLTEEAQKLGYVSIEEGKRLGHQVINAIIQKHENLLSYFAKEPFVFTTELEHSNTHIIQYTVQNIAAIRNNEVLLEGEWLDTDTNDKFVKRIKVNCNTQSVMYYSPILRSNHAQLNPNTYTKTGWDKFVKELIKLRDENRK